MRNRFRLFKRKGVIYGTPDLSAYALKSDYDRLMVEVEFLAIKLNKLTKVRCYQCKRVLVHNLNAIYTNFEGKKFCSHECIDAAKKRLGGSTASVKSAKESEQDVYRRIQLETSEGEL